MPLTGHHCLNKIYQPPAVRLIIARFHLFVCVSLCNQVQQAAKYLKN